MKDRLSWLAMHYLFSAHLELLYLFPVLRLQIIVIGRNRKVVYAPLSYELLEFFPFVFQLLSQEVCGLLFLQKHVQCYGQFNPTALVSFTGLAQVYHLVF